MKAKEVNSFRYLFDEIRMYLSVMLIGWVIKIAPKNKEGLILLTFIHDWTVYSIKNRKNES